MDSNIIADQLSESIIVTLKECPDISISPKQFGWKKKPKTEYKEDDGSLTPLPEDPSSDDEDDQCASAASLATFKMLKNTIKDGLDRILSKCIAYWLSFL